MTWTPPPDVATVVKYRVALTTSAAGPGRQQGEVAVGTNRLDIPLHTPLGSFTHLPVSTVNAAGAQDTPVALLLVDHKPPSFSVSNLAFSDVDKRHDELSGTVMWSAPADAALVKSYRVYFAKAAGCGYTDKRPGAERDRPAPGSALQLTLYCLPPRRDGQLHTRTRDAASGDAYHAARGGPRPASHTCRQRGSPSEEAGTGGDGCEAARDAGSARR